MASGGYLDSTGLDVVITDLRNGRVFLELKDDTGVIYSNEYKNRASARTSAAYWAKSNYGLEHTEVVEVEEEEELPAPKAKPKRKSTKPLQRVSNIIMSLTAQADRHEVEAIDLRAQAEKLEREAKKLRAAVDALTEGDER